MPLRDECDDWLDLLTLASEGPKPSREERLWKPPLQHCAHCNRRMIYDKKNCHRVCTGCGRCFRVQLPDNDIYWGDYLKTHRYPRRRKNYHCAKRIRNKLRSCPKMSPRQMSVIEDLFEENEELIKNVHREHDRMNLNYNFVIHQFCRLLRYDECIGHFPTNASESVLKRSMEVWREVEKRISFRTITI